MNPILAGYDAQFTALHERIGRLVAGLSEEDLLWRPAAGEWSMVECLEHLNSAWKVIPKLDRKIGEAREKNLLSDGPFAEPWLGRLYIRLIEPPARVKVNAPRQYRPRSDPPPAEVVPRIQRLQEELGARVRSADGLDVGAIRMSSPISRRFKMTLGQWFAFLAAHERRHLCQAERVRERRLSVQR
ncbi:MAG: DinB family protein [Acidobacteriota bacterium]|nr:DinB family protein [Acidobacteriota bacterium]